MGYEFKKLADVEALSEVPENASVLAEVDGNIRRIPGSGLGGSVEPDLILSFTSSITLDAVVTSKILVKSGSIANVVTAIKNNKTPTVIFEANYSASDYNLILSTIPAYQVSYLPGSSANGWETIIFMKFHIMDNLTSAGTMKDLILKFDGAVGASNTPIYAGVF